MRKPLVLSLLIYGLLLAGLATLHGELLALAIPFIVYLMFGLWRSPEEINLEIQRNLSAERVAPHEPVTVEITISNHGLPLEELLVEDVVSPALQISEGSNRHLLRLPTGKSYTWSYIVSGPRGYYPFTSLRVEASDSLGLVHRQKSIFTSGQLFILPPVLRLRHVAIRPRRTRVYSGLIPARAGGPGIEFFSVREYQTGDPPHWINWRISARHPQDLYSNEFEQERVSDVGIILDGRELTNLGKGERSLFEYSIMATAALSDALLAQGNRLGLLLYGQFLHWTYPGYGKIQRERILQVLSRAQPGGSQIFTDLEYLPAQLFPTNSQIILVSPLVAGDLPVLITLKARGYQVLVVSPDPVAFELSCLPRRAAYDLAARVLHMERRLLLLKLNRAGVQVLDWNVERPFDQVVHSALGRPPAWLRAIGR